ncbi:transposase, IS701 family [Bathymodiolus platifrons methanotrophic gill symbiont]|uniref:IS701 family transposase n=2 Tax=Bathymodiolus platifrons methanotrophic gill symbiont TaxID=113268 RepID=UPI001B6B7247|nr:transposase [Bathymodiolus platifrons methanotrophic gill symbiont]GFO76567.1 transposase, IS701 family [Bathymodiolus platifrons methanotrophic gill symbiont]
MFILRDILLPLQDHFSETTLGRERASLFVYTILSIIVPFTSSMTSNLWRCLDTLFGFEIKNKRFYTFMASPTLPWAGLWQTIWGLIPSPETDGRILVGLDDSIITKVGKKIFGCEAIFDHAAKSNQSKYPWAQNIVSVGMLKQVKGRWACLFLDFRFYLPLKTIQGKKETATIRGEVVPFQTKMAQAAQMLIEIAEHFSTVPILAVTDSWFGNNGLWKPAYKAIGNRFNILSRLRCNNVLYDLPEKRKPKQRGRNKKYGQRLGSATDMAKTVQQEARLYNVNLYGKQREVSAYSRVVMLKTLKRPVQVVWVFRRTQWIALFTTDLNLSITQIIEYYGARWKIESGFKELKQDIGSQKSQCRNAQAVTNHLNFCMMVTTLTWIYADRLKNNPERRHKVKGRTSFAFSDIRRIIAEAALDPDFERVCPKYSSSPVNSVVTVLLRMVA